MPHTKTYSSDSLDEAFTIKAAPGEVEIELPANEFGQMTLKIPASWIDEFIRKLEAARDAAALMEASQSKPRSKPNADPKEPDDGISG